jgi:hypothetical protein
MVVGEIGLGFLAAAAQAFTRPGGCASGDSRNHRSTRMKPATPLLLVGLAIAATMVPASAAITLLSENWETAGMASGDISNATNAPLAGWAGFGLNNDNPTMLLVPSGGNVLRDQAGFGGTYGSADNAGNATRVRPSNGAMLNEDPLQLDTLAATSVTFSFDLKQVTANYVQVVEFSNNTGFLKTGGSNTVVLLDTIDGLGTLGLWEAKSYTLVDGVDASFTDASYFRIRKLRPNPAGTTAGANSTFHGYDNLVITAEVPPSAPESFQLKNLTSPTFDPLTTPKSV